MREVVVSASQIQHTLYADPCAHQGWLTGKLPCRP